MSHTALDPASVVGLHKDRFGQVFGSILASDDMAYDVYTTTNTTVRV